jgi:hypothetical protein
MFDGLALFTDIHIFRQFTTATRNYSKQQLKWFRQDNRCLWLEIFRHRENIADPGVVISPYRQVADEVLHWFQLPRQEYDAMIKDQIRTSAVVTELRNQIRSRRYPTVRSFRHEMALHKLQAVGEWKKELIKFEQANDQVGPAGAVGVEPASTNTENEELASIKCQLNPCWSAEGAVLYVDSDSCFKIKLDLL